MSEHISGRPVSPYNPSGRISAVVFDLDDTLLRDDLSLSSFTVQVFRTLSRRNIHLIAASGRAQASMKPFVDQLGCVSVYISCNGAEIWNGRDDRLIHRELFPTSLALEIAEFGEKHDCYAQVYEGNSFFFNRFGKYADSYAATSRLNGIFVGDLTKYICEPRNKILMMDSEQKISRLYHEAKKIFDGRASVTCSKPYFLEFNPLNATKGKALQVSAGFLGINVEEMIAFGDSLNDLSMFQTAGIAVTVKNGWDSVLPFCDYVCGTNNEDGPAHFLKDHYLAEEHLS